MPVDKRGEALRAALRKKSQSELESLLAAAFSEEYDTVQADELAVAVMEVMCEREEDVPAMSQAELDASWEDFQRRLAADEKTAEEKREPERTETTADAGTAKDPKPMRTSPARKSRNTPQKTRFLRLCVTAAVLAFFICGATVASALGFNVFQAIADWTAEQFGFVRAGKEDVGSEDDPLWSLRVIVMDKCDVPSVPTWVPEGTQAKENVSIEERSDRTIIRCGYEAQHSEFTIHIIIYNTIPEDYTGTYQKDGDGVECYEAGTVTHYLMDNNDRSSAAWTNGRLEGHIQGDLSINDLKNMIDSIYVE